MADTDHQTVGEEMTFTIKLTGRLISAAHEYLWGIDDDSAPAALPKLIESLQGVGKTLSAIRKYSTVDFSASVFQILNAPNGPIAECAANMSRLHVKTEKGDAGLGVMVEQGHLMPYMRQLEMHRKVFVLALQVLQDQSKLSEAMAGYVQDTDRGKIECDNPLVQVAQVLEKKKKDLSWLYSGDYESGLKGILERSVPGMGEWIKQSPIFLNWMKANPGFLHLWGRAIGGAGKTHISGKIIEHIQAMPQTSKCAVAYFFFAHMEPKQKQPTDVLRCLILQLACQASYFKSVSRVLHLRLEEQQPPPKINKLSRALVDTARLFERVYIVLDDLDEYEHQADLLPFFRTLATANISVFVTSQPQGLVGQDWLLAAAKIDLSARAGDIKTYIQLRIDGCVNANAKCPLGQGANRDKFLYVHLVIRSLLQQPTVNHIFSELQKLKPITPHEDQYNTIYTCAIANIRAQPKNRAAIALKILLWVTKAQQTLTVSALREAIAITPNSRELDKLDLCDPQMILDVCEDLITIDKESGNVRLLHPTARSSLLKILPADADHQMAVACLTYLSYSTFSKPASMWGEPGHQSMEDRLKENPFYEYAVKNLSAHINACNLALTTQVLVNFARHESKIQSYFQVLWSSFWCENKKRLPLLMAVHVGHLPVVRQFLNKTIDPFSPDETKRTILHWAVYGNHIDVVRLLLDHSRRQGPRDEEWESDLWCHDEMGKSVLHLAARKGFKELVEMFLDHGADISMIGEGGQTPLHESVKGGHEDVVQLLLANGADSWSKEEIGQTALHIAAAEGHLGIVKQLLQYRNNFTPRATTLQDWPVRIRNVRCDVSASDSQKLTPLHLAALGSHTKVVQLLLEEGANSLAQAHNGETVLHQAARGGDVCSVQLLLDHGADVTAKNRNNVTVLHRAAFRGYTDMIKVLLDHGAEISPRLDDRTALELALNGGYEEAVQLLRLKGAETPVPANVDKMLVDAAYCGDDGLVELLLAYGANPSGEPLIDAAEYGHLNVVNLLLKGGANVLPEDNNPNVLQGAVKNGHQAVAKLLLDNGAEIPTAIIANGMLVGAAGAGYRAVVELLLNHGVDTCGEALYQGAANGHLDVITLLLARGTDIHFRNSSNWMVFHIAVYNGHQNVVELLLRHGADIHAQGKNQQTALHHASYGKNNKGHVGLVQLLLKAGADISVKDKCGRTALILASRGGPVEVVRALQAHGADGVIQDINGWTALHHAANGGHIDIVRLLSSYSAVQNMNNQTALVLAASNGHKGVLEALLPYPHHADMPEDIHPAFFLAAANGHHEATSLLLNRGANVKTTDKEARTAFIIAVENGHSKVLEVLLRFNADISEKTNDGESALFVATRNGCVDVVRLLLEKGTNVSEKNKAGQTALFVAGECRNRDVYSLLIEKGVNQLVRDQNGNMASIDESDDDYDNYDDPWYPHGW